jgi:hypothetical protein
MIPFAARLLAAKMAWGGFFRPRISSDASRISSASRLSSKTRHCRERPASLAAS